MRWLVNLLIPEIQSLWQIANIESLEPDPRAPHATWFDITSNHEAASKSTHVVPISQVTLESENALYSDIPIYQAVATVVTIQE